MMLMNKCRRKEVNGESPLKHHINPLVDIKISGQNFEEKQINSIVSKYVSKYLFIS